LHLSSISQPSPEPPSNSSLLHPQWIISHAAWTYPPSSILFKIYHVPIEEHLFFILQPLLLVLVQAVAGVGRGIPFAWRGLPVVGIKGRGVDEQGVGDGDEAEKDDGIEQGDEVEDEDESKKSITPNPSPTRIRTLRTRTSTSTSTRIRKTTIQEEKVQTLPRRPLAGLFWLGMMILGGIGLFIPLPILCDTFAHPATGLTQSGFLTFFVQTLKSPFQLQLQLQPVEDRLFYLSAILIWISPVLALLTALGAKVDLREDWIAWAVGTGWLWMVDTVAIRAGAWEIDTQGKRTLGWVLWRGLPVE
jgi:15-cis-phytoene synthase/lycopene beta-cyclase